MEARIVGIIRWLERCIKAYKEGAMESALMDAECARADIETLRGDLWRKLERRSLARRRFNAFRVAEAFFWALGITLITATPLALQQDGYAREGRMEGHTLEWVTPDERELLSNVRKRPDESLALIAKPEEPIVEHQVVGPQAEPQIIARAAAAEPVRRRNQEPQPLQSEQSRPETSLPYDRILSLVETGERAMMNKEPAIRVENASGR